MASWVLKCVMIIVTTISLTLGCGCYGPTSCDIFSQPAGYNETGVCDCCSSCNTCDQLLYGCAIWNTKQDGYFSPSLPHTFYLNQPLDQYYLFSKSSMHLQFPICIRPELPEGLTFNQTTDGKIYLSGIAKELHPPTQHIIRAKGVAESIIAMTFILHVDYVTSYDVSAGCMIKNDLFQLYSNWACSDSVGKCR